MCVCVCGGGGGGGERERERERIKHRMGEGLKEDKINVDKWQDE